MPSLTQLIAEYGLLLVFAHVRVEQLGALVPAVPTMVAAGAPVAIGRHSGRRALNPLCRLSPSPEDCAPRDLATATAAAP